MRGFLKFTSGGVKALSICADDALASGVSRARRWLARVRCSAIH